MSGLDVEALLDSTANTSNGDKDDTPVNSDDRKSDRRDRDRGRDGSRERNRRYRDRSRDAEGDDSTKSPGGSHRSRRTSRNRDDDRRSRSHRDSPRADRDGDYYRGGGRHRSRSRDNHYRPRDDRRGRDDTEGVKPRDDRRRSHSPKKPAREKTPPLTEDERDRRTVFVQQLAARLRTKELVAFFEKVGPVKEAQIVKDRVSGRSKGYTYFLFVFQCDGC